MAQICNWCGSLIVDDSGTCPAMGCVLYGIEPRSPAALKAMLAAAPGLGLTPSAPPRAG